MKKAALKNRQLITMVTVTICFLCSCNKQPLMPKEETIYSTAKLGSIKNLVANNPFNKDVGAPVDGFTGIRWIANYIKKNGVGKSYTLNNNYLQTILSQPGCVGISLHYAKDPNNKVHILPIGVNGVGKIMQSNSMSTMQGNITWATAQQWIANDLGPINSHFLGSKTFDRLNENPCDVIMVDFAIDDKFKQQLLLSNPCELKISKRYEDNSLPCPSICPNP